MIQKEKQKKGIERESKMNMTVLLCKFFSDIFFFGVLFWWFWKVFGFDLDVHLQLTFMLVSFFPPCWGFPFFFLMYFQLN